VADHGLQDELLAFIEIPKGSRNKYEFDEGIERVILDRFLSSSTVYPTDYGYLMDHRGRDGDPLDTLVLVSEPTFPGCVIPVRPIALFKMTDEKGEDDKIICVPLHDPGWNTLEDLDDLTDQFQLEVAHFFSVYKQLDRKPVEIGGWHPRSAALEVIEDARRLHEQETRAS
jgi:inorganic pyrophosphatase